MLDNRRENGFVRGFHWISRFGFRFYCTVAPFVFWSLISTHPRPLCIYVQPVLPNMVWNSKRNDQILHHQHDHNRYVLKIHSMNITITYNHHIVYMNLRYKNIEISSQIFVHVLGISLSARRCLSGGPAKNDLVLDGFTQKKNILHLGEWCVSFPKSW